MLGLFSIFCTAAIPAQTLSDILEAAYAESSEARPSLYLVYSKDSIAQTGDKPGATLSPVASTPNNDFHGESLHDLAAFVRTAESKGISRDFFLVADEQTAQDRTVLLVKCTDAESLQSVRVAANQTNAPVVAVDVGCGSIAELQYIAGEEGVFRGSTGPPPPKKGLPAPRKPLKSRHAVSGHEG